MAPRGTTSSKPRGSRMNAAVDAMKKFGFEEKRIKHTVKELLKVYGGAKAWPFIEDDRYGTLFELLLKEGENEEVKQTMVSEQHLETPLSTDNNASGTFPENAGMEEFQATPLTILPPPPPKRRRKPCYGWISDHDDDEED